MSLKSLGSVLLPARSNARPHDCGLNPVGVDGRLKRRQASGHEYYRMGCGLRHITRHIARRFLEVQVFVDGDGALHQDAAFTRCDLNHTATCC
jgi:hypothetical protein